MLQRLHTVTLTFKIASMTTADNVGFPICMCGFFNPPTSPTQLKSIVIQLIWVDSLQGNEENRLVGDPGWDVLDEIFSQESFHPKLTSVFFKLKLGYILQQDQLSNCPPQKIVAKKKKFGSLASNLFQKIGTIRSWRPKLNIAIYERRICSWFPELLEMFPEA